MSLLEDEVGERLTRLAAEVDVAPARWSDVRAGMLGVRRRRRHVRAARVGAGVLTIAAVVGGVQGGVLPYPSWGPAVTLDAASSGPSELASFPTRGSLTDDDAWLAEFRSVVADHERVESVERWSVTAPDDVVVLFAGDVEGVRVAVVEAPYRFGVVEAWQQVWFTGPPDAAPEEMAEAQVSQTGDVAAGIVRPVSRGRPGTDDTSAAGSLVVLTRPGSVVTVDGPDGLGADGTRVRYQSTPTPVDDGVTVLAADRGAQDLRVDGRVVLAFGSAAEVSVQVPGSTGLPPVAVTAAVQFTLDGLRLPPMSGAVVWADPGVDRPYVVVLDDASGARVLVAGRFSDGGPGSPEPLRGVDVARVLPAGESVVLAWQVGTTTWTVEPDGRWTGGDGPSPVLALVGDGVSAELLDDQGAVVGTVPLVAGGATADASGVSSVRFLSADGSEVGSTPVVSWAPGNDRPEIP